MSVTRDPFVHNGAITIYSPIPDNFVPRVITFDVENGDHIVQSVRVTQYPPIWIGHILSQDVDGNKNRNMYTVNIKQADLRTIPMPDVPTRGSWGRRPHPRVLPGADRKTVYRSPILTIR